MNRSTSSGGSQVAPRRTEISLAERSGGMTASNALTFGSNSSAFSFAYSCALRSFSLTLPDRYSSAGRYFGLLLSSKCPGLRKITPLRSSVISSSVLPVNSHIYGMSIRAFSARDRASASDAVSTAVTTTFCLMVRLVNISALRMNCPSSSRISREESRQ